MLNPWQRMVADTYGGGDYAHIETVEESEDVGDTLFTFLMRELADSEGCEDWDEAHRRIDVAMEQLAELADQAASHV